LLQELTADVDCSGHISAQPDPVCVQVVAAASQLPLLEELHMPGALLPLAATKPAWAQLASIIGMRRLTLGAMGVQPPPGSGATTAAAPALGITSLKLHRGVCGWQDDWQLALPPLQPGSLAALLPELQQLNVKSCYGISSEYSHYHIAAALQGHQQLQALRIDCDCWPQEEQQQWGCWAPGRRPLSSMPRLRLLHLLRGCTRLGLDELLADAAGCPELQELEVEYSGERCAQQPLQQEEAVTGWGLAALARGACRWRLRSLWLKPFETWVLKDVGFPIHHVAALLGDGACPQLEFLNLNLQLDLGALVELQLELDEWAGRQASKGQQGHQRATAGILQRWLIFPFHVRDQLKQGMEHVEVLLERQLEALGVVGDELYFDNELMCPLVAGCVGGCAVTWVLSGPGQRAHELGSLGWQLHASGPGRGGDVGHSNGGRSGQSLRRGE
jgi:hypothetical protein